MICTLLSEGSLQARGDFEVVHGESKIQGRILVRFRNPQCARDGISNELLRAGCYAQIVGLAVATFITLLLVPVLYSIFVPDLKIIRWKRSTSG